MTEQSFSRSLWVSLSHLASFFQAPDYQPRDIKQNQMILSYFHGALEFSTLRSISDKPWPGGVAGVLLGGRWRVKSGSYGAPESSASAVLASEVVVSAERYRSRRILISFTTSLAKRNPLKPQRNELKYTEYTE